MPLEQRCEEDQLSVLQKISLDPECMSFQTRKRKASLLDRGKRKRSQWDLGQDSTSIATW